MYVLCVCMYVAQVVVRYCTFLIKAVIRYYRTGANFQVLIPTPKSLPPLPPSLPPSPPLSLRPQMFFINRGTVEVVSEDGTVVFATMNEGKFFGEISLIFSCPRTASIRSGDRSDQSGSSLSSVAKHP